MKKLLIILALAAFVTTLTACETMHGMGKDVENAGEWVQKKSD